MTENTGLKAIAERSALNKVLGHTKNVVERRNTIPILGNVLITAKQDSLTLKATDLDLVITESIPAEVAVPGAVSVPAHLLADIVRKFPEGAQVLLEASAEKATLVVRAGRSRFTLQTLPESDFPNHDIGELSHSFKLTGAQLKRLITKAEFAISTEETRYYLNGIFLHSPIRNGNRSVLRAVATDGHRLAQIDMDLPDGATGMPGVIWPRKCVGEVEKLIENAEAEITVSLSRGRIKFEFGDIVLVSKLIDWTYPDYARVIPVNNSKQLKVDKKDLEQAVDRVATISSERGRAVKVALTAGKLELSVSNPDAGSSVEEMEVEYEADPLDIGFNSKYLGAIVAQCEGEHATIMLADPGSPTLFRGSDEDALYVCMPMRV